MFVPLPDAAEWLFNAMCHLISDTPRTSTHVLVLVSGGITLWMQSWTRRVGARMDATPLASLPTECLVSILLQGSLEALGRTARTCADCRSAALDVGLWRVLLSTVWLADAGAEAAVAAGHCVLPTTATATPRAEFLRRFHLHSRLHQMRLGEGDYLMTGTFLTMLPAAPSLTQEEVWALTAAERSLSGRRDAGDRLQRPGRGRGGKRHRGHRVPAD